MERTIVTILTSGLVYGLGYRVGQSDFVPLIALYAVLFGLYLWILRRAGGEEDLRFYTGLAVWLRVLLLFSMPNLSDDVYRFIWDGRLLLNGINPFEHLPAWYMEPGRAVAALTPDLYARLNSPEYFTIYPPVAQATFFLACLLSPESIWGSALVMKGVLLGCELGTLWLLPRLLEAFELPRKRLLIYALNPLILIEVMGNIHFEGAMVFFLLLAWWWLVRGQAVRSAGAMGLSVAAKLLPLMFLPLLIRRLGRSRSLVYFTWLALALSLLFGPFLGAAFWSGFTESLDLYFRRFEFNASVYYLLRWLGYQWKGYNLIASIGPWLALATLTGILLLAALERRPDWRNLAVSMLGVITLYLLFGTTIHPWYLSLPVVLCLFTPFRYPLLWSGLIFLTYINYSYEPYYENLWMVGLEYGLVLPYALYEWKNRWRLKKNED